MGLFLAFAIWACAKLGGGILGSIGRGAAIANVAVTMVSLGVLDAEAYLASTAASPTNLGQLSTLVTLIWIAATSITLASDARPGRAAVAVAT